MEGLIIAKKYLKMLFFIASKCLNEKYVYVLKQQKHT